MANEREVNEVIINNQVTMTTRGDTVSQNNLVRDETATNKAGQKIVGELDVEGLMAKTYMITDPIDQIEERDYVPFNDVSDSEMPKKKTLFSDIIEKLKSFFIGKKSTSGDAELNLTNATLDLKMNNIDASKLDNNVSAMTYPATSNILDCKGRIIMRTEAVVNPNGNIGWKAYVRNYDIDGQMVAQKGMQFNMDKSGNLSYIIGDPNAFRSAISTVDQLGTKLETGTTIDNYHGTKYCGTYYIPSDAVANEITTLPENLCGKLIVANNGNGGFSQYYIPNHSVKLWVRVWWNGAWSEWQKLANIDDIQPIQVGNGYAVGTINGTAITATITGFRLRAGVIVVLSLGAMPVNATLNINNTGAKSIYWDNTTVRKIDIPRIASAVWTFMYDGSVYRIISLNRTPMITAQNYVADTTGNITATYGYDQNAYQIKYNLVYDKLVWNYYKNSDWRGDVRIADYDDIVHQYLGEAIPSNSDFNSYTTNGIYNVSSNPIAITLSNRPCNYAGKLIVQKVAANQYVKQTYISYDQPSADSNGQGFYERSYNGDTGGGWRPWRKFVEATDGRAELFTETTTSEDKSVGINARIYDSTTNKTYARQVMRIYQDHQATPYGFNMVIDSGGASIIASGEAGLNHYGVLTKPYANEHLFLTSDENIYLQANAIDIADRKGFMIDANGYLLPCKEDNVVNNQGQIGTSNNKLADIWTNKINGQNVTEPQNIAPATAVTGKNIIPTWYSPTTTYTARGITFSLNPSNGSITVNGTATEDVSYTIWRNVDAYYLPKGSYVLSGCPSGGGDSTYFLRLQIKEKGKNEVGYTDKGSGVAFTLTEDAHNTSTSNYYIKIMSGVTANNLVFYPMVRPSWTTEDYEPNENIHKGNGYVGLCTTAADQQIKVAFVDGYFVLRTGVRVAIKFSYTNTFNSQTSTPVQLNVNNTGAKNIWYNTTHSGSGNTGTFNTAYGYANRYTFYVYDGTYWVWSGHGQDTNSTGYVPNNATSTITASDQALNLCLKSTGIDLKEANNGVSEIKYPSFHIQDKNGYDISKFESCVKPDGKIETFLQVRNYKTSDGTNPNGGFKVIMDKNGTVTYWTSYPNNFNAAMGFGYGTCTTAADQQVKAVTLANFVLSVGATVNVRFTNTNSYNSTTSAPCQLNVNGTGAKNIWYANTHSGAGNTGTNTRIYGEANRVFTYTYDGTYWVWQSCGYEADTVDPCWMGFGYGTCDTAEATTAKVVSLTNYTLRTGGYVTVKFTNAVPASATMNINSRGAKNIYYRGSAITANQIKAGDRATFIYDGTNYHLIGVDRDNYLKINYWYSNSTGTPSSSYLSNKVSELKITEMSYVVEGDVVTLGLCLHWDASTSYSSGTTLFKLNCAPRQNVYWASHNSSIYGWINTGGNFLIRPTTASGNYYVQVTYITSST